MILLYVLQVVDMTLRRKRVRQNPEMEAGTVGSATDGSDNEYRCSEEAGTVESVSTSLAEELSNSSRSSDDGKGEMRSKKRHDAGNVGQGIGRGSREGGEDRAGKRGRGKEAVRHGKVVEDKGKGKGKDGDVSRRGSCHGGGEGGREKAVDGEVRHRCSLDAICALNEQLVDIQKEAIRGTIWSPVLEYRKFLMDRHLVHALLEAWRPERKCFKLGQREVPFSYYDVAMLTGLPATRKRIAFKRGEGAYEVEEVLKGAMEERVVRERERRRTARMDLRIYRNYVSVLLDLCRVHNTVDSVGLFTKLYSLLVVSGLLFPRTPGGVAWDLVPMVEDVGRLEEYNWSEAVWEFLVDAMAECQEKMGSMKNLKINGFTMILQVM